MFPQMCQYKDLFGKPREGLRIYRIFDIAVYDVVVTVVIAWILCWVINQYILPGLEIRYRIPVLPFLLCVFLLGIAAHRAFCVRTVVDKMLFYQQL